MWPTFYIPRRIKPRINSRFYLTTMLYPIEVREDMRSASAYNGGYQYLSDKGTIKSGTAFIGGTIATLLRSYVHPNEDMLVSGTMFLSGSLPKLLVEYVSPLDGYTSSTSILGGSMARQLVQYDNWLLVVSDEQLQSGTVFLGGTLS